MTVRTCDKCGRKININSMGNTILPIFSVSMLDGNARGWRTVDLCPICEKKLSEWLNSNEVEEQDR